MQLNLYLHFEVCDQEIIYITDVSVNSLQCKNADLVNLTRWGHQCHTPAVTSHVWGSWFCTADIDSKYGFYHILWNKAKVYLKSVFSLFEILNTAILTAV